MKKWKLLSSEYISKASWATLRRDTCEMPDGRINDHYYVLEYPNWVNAFAVTEQNEVIIVKQYRHGSGQITTEIPGGVIEKGEFHEQAAIRETLEETGYTFSHVEKLAELYANPATSNNITYSYLLTGGKKTQNQHLDENEDIEVELIPLEKVKEMVLNNEFQQALHTSTIFYALKKLGLL